MHMEDTDLGLERNRRDDGWKRLGARLRRYLRTRTTDHWIMFLAGVVIGAILA